MIAKEQPRLGESYYVESLYGSILVHTIIQVHNKTYCVLIQHLMQEQTLTYIKFFNEISLRFELTYSKKAMKTFLTIFACSVGLLLICVFGILWVDTTNTFIDSHDQTTQEIQQVNNTIEMTGRALVSLRDLNEIDPQEAITNEEVDLLGLEESDLKGTGGSPVYGLCIDQPIQMVACSSSNECR
jgi:hypothetical protein